MIILFVLLLLIVHVNLPDVLRKFFRVLIYLGIFISFLLITAGSLVYFYKGDLITAFVNEANKRLSVPVKVDHIDISFFEKFPKLAIKFEQVEIADIGEADTLMTKLGKLYGTFDMLSLIRNKYKIDQLYLEDGFLVLKKRLHGGENYNLIKGDTKKASQPVDFAINQISLRNVKLYYVDELSYVWVEGLFEDVESKLKRKGANLEINSSGALNIDKIKVNEEIYAQSKSLLVDFDLNYNQNNKNLQISPSTFGNDQAGFVVEGMIETANQKLDIALQGDNTNIQTLVSFLPASWYDQFKAYRSKGNVYFNAEAVGSYGNQDFPSLNIDFGCENASFFHPKSRQSLDHVNLKGNYNNGEKQNLSTSSLKLQNIHGELHNKSFSGDILIYDLKRYYLNLDLEADLDVKSFLKFYPISNIKTAKGEIAMDIEFKGYLKDLNPKVDIRNAKSSGEVIVKDVDFELAKFDPGFSDFQGHFLLKNNTLAISDLSGKIGQSDFKVNGMFRNILSYLFLENRDVNIEADLISGFINLEELLSGQQEQSDDGSKYSFQISPRLNVDFRCDVGHLQLKRFHGRNIKGNFSLQDQKLASKGINIETMGGSIAMNGNLDATKNHRLEIFTSTQCKRIDIDSIFYVFENFNQDFLVDKHLKGQIFAQLNTFVVLDNHLKLQSEELISDIQLTIRNGELNDFEPMQNLSKYVDKESLKRLKFTDLSNQILVHNRKIHLPKMEVGTNITKISLSGTHTFDQEIDYHLVIPIKRYKRTQHEARFGPLEEDESGNLNMFLKFQGTTKDYKVIYDTKAWKEKIKQDLKDEGQELKQAFKNKGVDKKPVRELSEEEFFDF